MMIGEFIFVASFWPPLRGQPEATLGKGRTQSRDQVISCCISIRFFADNACHRPLAPVLTAARILVKVTPVQFLHL